MLAKKVVYLVRIPVQLLLFFCRSNACFWENTFKTHQSKFHNTIRVQFYPHLTIHEQIVITWIIFWKYFGVLFEPLGILSHFLYPFLLSNHHTSPLIDLKILHSILCTSEDLKYAIPRDILII